MSKIDIVFDGPPSHESGRFVETEDENRASISIGDWVERDDGYWVLRIERDAEAEAKIKSLESVNDSQRRDHYEARRRLSSGWARQFRSSKEEWAAKIRIAESALAQAREENERLRSKLVAQTKAGEVLGRWHREAVAEILQLKAQIAALGKEDDRG